ncbi:MAG: hypothetical protein HQK67_01460 [Desulfamplus sp.]|nr:hypothetical protein [Desulfamplus sp.]
MRLEFLEILQGTYELLSWNREMGVEYLELSDESLSIIRTWGDKKSADAKISPSDQRTRTVKRAQTDKIVQTGKTVQIGKKTETGSATETGTIAPSDKIMPSGKINPIGKINQIGKIKPSGAIIPPINDGVDFKEDLIQSTGDLNSKIFFFSDTLNYSEPSGELFLKILKAMNLNRNTICLTTFESLDYTRGIPRVREQVNNIRNQVEQLINDKKSASTIQTNRTDPTNKTEPTNRIHRLNPEIICTFGDSALKILMGREYMLTTSRGRFHNYNGIHVMPTYHPAQILADKSLKRWVWEDIKQIMAIQ